MIINAKERLNCYAARWKKGIVRQEGGKAGTKKEGYKQLWPSFHYIFYAS